VFVLQDNDRQSAAATHSLSRTHIMLLCQVRRQHIGRLDYEYISCLQIKHRTMGVESSQGDGVVKVHGG